MSFSWILAIWITRDILSLVTNINSENIFHVNGGNVTAPLKYRQISFLQLIFFLLFWGVKKNYMFSVFSPLFSVRSFDVIHCVCQGSHIFPLTFPALGPFNNFFFFPKLNGTSYPNEVDWLVQVLYGSLTNTKKRSIKFSF